MAYPFLHGVDTDQVRIQAGTQSAEIALRNHVENLVDAGCRRADRRQSLFMVKSFKIGIGDPGKKGIIRDKISHII